MARAWLRHLSPKERLSLPPGAFSQNVNLRFIRTEGSTERSTDPKPYTAILRGDPKSESQACNN